MRAGIRSPLLVIDPIERGEFEHREFWPLANARAHQLGPRRQITNPDILTQYQRLLAILTCRREFSEAERLAVVSALLLQDRVGEALGWFDDLSSATPSAPLTRDYLAAYVALYRRDLDGAEATAKRYAEYPVDRWQKLFHTVLAHVTEARGGQPDPADPANREQRQAELAAQSPNFEFTVESREIRLQHQNLAEVTINYYTMDVELLFSRNPFVQQQSGGFSLIRPNLSQVVSLAADQKATTIKLPAEFDHANVLVEIRGGGLVRSAPYYAHSLAVQVNENYGQLQVRQQEDQQPLGGVYVKVYARRGDGRTVFYKDGYTDLRGRFDYTSLSNQSLDDIERFSMLVLSDERGAVIREAGIPKE